MKVCYWGTYDRGYSRNKILISGLRKNGEEVVECHAGIWRNTAEKMSVASSGWLNFKVLFRWCAAYCSLIRRFISIKDIDVIVVGYSGHFDVFIAKMLSKIKRTPLVFDVFLSLYDSLVFDRKVVRKGSLKAKLLYAVDKYSCKLADLVLLDTEQHIDYFISEFNLPKNKFQRVLIGADDSVFSPHNEKKEDNTPFTVLHFGKYIPLHGMAYIIKAAKELEPHDIRFQLIGAGDEYESSVKLVKELELQNVEFIEFLEQKELTQYIHHADICLGIFGETEKAKRVIPNKVYEAMAMKKPVITGNSPAAKEFLKHGENCFLCKMGNPYAIAEAILTLRADDKLRQKIAEKAYDDYTRFCSPFVLGQEVANGLIQMGK